jgi:hypothetical protein
VVDASDTALPTVGIALMPGHLQRTTDVTGTFVFDSLKPGRYTVTARMIGRTSVSGPVTVAAGELAHATIEMGAPMRLAPMVTRDVKSRDRQEYERRRAAHIGYALDGDQLAVRADVYSALSTFPRLQLRREGSGVTVRVRMEPKNWCTPVVFLDGIKVDIEFASALVVEQLRAVEVFTQPFDVPPEFGPVGCAAIFFWSKNRKW